MRKARSKNTKMLLTGLACLSLLIWSGCTGKEDEPRQETDNRLPDQAIAVEVIEVQAGNLSPNERFVGEIYPYTSTLVFPKVAGTLEHLLIKKGDIVTKNQVLGEINQRDYLFTLREAEVRLEEAQARLVQAQTVVSTSADAQLEQLRRLLELAEANYQRTKSLVEAGALPSAQLDTAETELLRAEQNVLAAEVAEEKNAAAEARDAAGIDVAKQAVKQAQINVEKAKTALHDTQIKAVVKGTVSEISISEGDQINPQQALAKIIDLDTVQVTIHVIEQELSLFQKDKQIDVFIPSLSAKVEGKVSFIALEADKSTQMFPIEITIANPEQAILPGMKADVLIAKEDSNEGILLPVQAVLEEDEQKFVYVLEQEQVRKQAIHILDNNTEFMLVNGLQAGDKVVVKAEAPLYDLAKVRLVESLKAN